MLPAGVEGFELDCSLAQLGVGMVNTLAASSDLAAEVMDLFLARAREEPGEVIRHLALALQSGAGVSGVSSRAGQPSSHSRPGVSPPEGP